MDLVVLEPGQVFSVGEWSPTGVGTTAVELIGVGALELPDDCFEEYNERLVWFDPDWPSLN